MTANRQRGLGAIRLLTAALILAGAVWGPTTAAAYVGRGAGLTFIASLLAVGVAVLIMIAGLVAFPIRLAMKAARKRREALAADSVETSETES